MMGSKIPIHVQAKLEMNENEDDYKRIMQPRACYNEYPRREAFTGTKVHDSE